MGAEQQFWDYGVKFTGEKTPPPPELKPAHDHDLQLDKRSLRWHCACGYTLGDGRDEFLAPCTRERDLL